MIPTMREIITGFNACDPAVHWSGDMDVQTGYELCTEPGWLMLLLWRIQGQKHANSFQQIVKTAHACIKAGIHLLHDELALDPLGTVMHQVEIGESPDLEKLKYIRNYLTKAIVSLDLSIRNSEEISASDLAELYMLKAVDSILGAVLFNDTNRKVAGDGAHSAIDMVIHALTADKYPKFVAEGMNKHGYSPQEKVVIRMFRLAKKVELCNILRSVTPQPFTSYE
jgi:hypothetical protein